MRLRLERAEAGAVATLGVLFVDDRFECFTLEDPVRAPGVKLPGDTAIPYGLYPLVITWSPRFQCRLPLICDVPQFEGVRIHPGNTTADTEGCILVGEELDGDRLLRSRVAFERLFPKIDAAQRSSQPIHINIVRTA